MSDASQLKAFHDVERRRSFEKDKKRTSEMSADVTVFSLSFDSMQ